MWPTSPKRRPARLRSEHRVGANEAGQQVGDIVDQRRIGDAQPRLEGVLGQPGEEPIQRNLRPAGVHFQISRMRRPYDRNNPPT